VGMVNLTTGEGMGEALINDLFGLLQPSSAHVSDQLDVASKDFILNRYPKLDVLILANSWEQLEPLNLSRPENDAPNKDVVHMITSPAGAKQVVIISQNPAFMASTIAELLNKSEF